MEFDIMQTGPMDRQLTFKKKTASGVDSLGAVTYTTTDLKMWAQRRELRGEERFTAQQRVAGLTARYYMQYRQDVIDNVTEQDTFVDSIDGKTYGIHEILPIGRREGIIIAARYPV